MAETSYTLAEQLHFVADTPDAEDVVVTVQRWAKRGTKPAGIYVVCINGVQANRRVCNTATSVDYLKKMIADTRAKHADHLLSEDAAATAVVRRGGPQLTWCHRTRSCGEAVPYAAAVCGAGHPTESVGRIQFASVTKQFTIAGGPNRG